LTGKKLTAHPGSNQKTGATPTHPVSIYQNNTKLQLDASELLKKLKNKQIMIESTRFILKILKVLKVKLASRERKIVKKEK